MTRDQMMSLQPAAGWDDGRRGFEWCRFDAVIDLALRLRAEVTWGDDGSPAPAEFTYPHLRLEYYRPDQVRGGMFEGEAAEAFDLFITDAIAREIVTAPPADLTRRYCDWFDRLPR